MLKLLKIALILSLLNSCAIAPPDVFICSELGEDGGYCKMTISPESKVVRGEEWRALRDGALILPFKSWEEIKIYILKTESRAAK